MNNTGIHRVTANSKAGRRLISGGSILEQVKQSEAIRIWNLDVAARKRQKEAERNARRAMARQRDEVNAAKATA